MRLESGANLALLQLKQAREIDFHQVNQKGVEARRAVGVAISSQTPFTLCIVPQPHSLTNEPLSPLGQNST
jgi:hypothetical protein